MYVCNQLCLYNWVLWILLNKTEKCMYVGKLCSIVCCKIVETLWVLVSSCKRLLRVESALLLLRMYVRYVYTHM